MLKDTGREIAVVIEGWSYVCGGRTALFRGRDAVSKITYINEEEMTNPTVTLPAPTDQLQPSTDPPTVVQSPDVSANTKKGSLITKTYVLKKPAVKRSFKCSECNTVKQTIQKLNEHHREMHNLSGYHADTPITIKAEAIRKADSHSH